VLLGVALHELDEQGPQRGVTHLVEFSLETNQFLRVGFLVVEQTIRDFADSDAIGTMKVHSRHDGLGAAEGCIGLQRRGQFGKLPVVAAFILHEDFDERPLAEESDL